MFLHINMKNNFTGEIIISLILIVLLSMFANPFNLFMPYGMHLVMVPLLVILFIVFAGFIWKEAPGDERDQLHKFIASRFAYFAGIATLIVGVMIQNSQGKIDPWIIIALCIALLAKILGLIYSHIKH